MLGSMGKKSNKLNFMSHFRTLEPGAAGAGWLIYTAILLTAFEYWLLPPRIEAWTQGHPGASWVLPPSLESGLGWVAACVLGFGIIPTLIHRAPRAHGLSFAGLFKHLKTYLGLYALMLPAILWASGDPHFAATYPFVPEAKESLHQFLLWEFAYVAQFFALESFFRGTLLFSLERATGPALAIAAMTVPYAMIHFHKPPLEAFGAIGAGLILGALALRYRSWLGGAILHSLVAVTMDTLTWR